MSEKSEKKLLYRILAQTDTMIVSADTSVELTAAEAREEANKHVLFPGTQYNNHVLQPIGTLNGWKYGHINFCPRCGKNISEHMGDSSEIVNNVQEFDCPECDATVLVDIIRTTEERDDDESDC